MSLSANRVKELFKYVDGRLVRKVSRGNTKYGSFLNTKSTKGYIRVLVDGRRYTEHQLVWIYFHDYLPKVIDHINGIKTDNRIEYRDWETGIGGDPIIGTTTREAVELPHEPLL